jgi:hypothetical protein
MLPVKSWALELAVEFAPKALEMVSWAALPLLVMVPLDDVLEKPLMVLLKPPKSKVAPVPTVTALALFNAVVLPALRVPALTVVTPE